MTSRVAPSPQSATALWNDQTLQHPPRRNGTQDRNRQNSQRLNLPLPEMWAEQRSCHVSSSLLLPQPSVSPHLIVNNCRDNHRKPQRGLPPPRSPSHQIDQTTRGPLCRASARFPHLLSQDIRSHSLGQPSRPISFYCADFYTEVYPRTDILDT